MDETNNTLGIITSFGFGGMFAIVMVVEIGIGIAFGLFMLLGVGSLALHIIRESTKKKEVGE